MQKSENKIKPMYFWSYGYKEYGTLEPDPKRIREDELAADINNIEDEFLFDPIVKKKKKSVQDDFKRWFRKHMEKRRRWRYLY